MPLSPDRGVYISFWKVRGFSRNNEMYKTETHLHTSEVSRCGKVSAAEMISRCKDAGYTTVFVSDHITPAYFKRYGELTWE